MRKKSDERRINKLTFDSKFHIKKRDLDYLIAVVEIAEDADMQMKESAIAAIARNIIGPDLRVNERVLEFLVSFYDKHKDNHDDKRYEWEEACLWLDNYDARLRGFFEERMRYRIDKGVLHSLLDIVNPLEYRHKSRYKRMISHRFSEEIRDKIEDIIAGRHPDENDGEENLNYTVVVEFSDDNAKTIKAINEVYIGLYEKTGRTLKFVEENASNKEENTKNKRRINIYYFSCIEHVDDFQLLLIEGDINHSVMPSEKVEDYLKQQRSDS